MDSSREDAARSLTVHSSSFTRSYRESCKEAARRACEETVMEVEETCNKRIEALESMSTIIRKQLDEKE